MKAIISNLYIIYIGKIVRFIEEHTISPHTPTPNTTKYLANLKIRSLVTKQVLQINLRVAVNHNNILC